MNKSNTLVMLVLTIVIFVSFFLPWVRVESQAVGVVAKALTGKKQAVIDNISGFQVPIMANSADARLMMSIIQIFNPGVTNADKKSYLIWLIPLLAVVIFIVSYFLGKNKWVNLAIGILGCAIFFVAAYKLKTIDLDKLVLNVSIAPGLWLILWGYLGMGLIGGINFIKVIKAK